jgi:hypothetical protein
MSTFTTTFSAPQIIREYATDRTKKPMYSLSDMQAQYASLKWSSMSVNVGDGKGVTYVEARLKIAFRGFQVALLQIPRDEQATIFA